MTYEDILGPPVRIGILQHEERIRFVLQGRYRMVTADKTVDLDGADLEFECSCQDTTPGELQWRLVLGKFRDEATADGHVVGQSHLQPLKTLRLGYEFGASASSVEYWRCSRPFASEAEANDARKPLSSPERIALLKELARPPAGNVCVKGPGCGLKANGWVRFVPLLPDTDRVLVHDVIVGIEYHWRHNERQRFRGVLEVRVDNLGRLTAINEVPVEAYLFSVNSSEMMSVMPEELLKAQTVAARNTVFATMGKHHYAEEFHLCSDDHCQCYRGSSRETADSRRVTLATLGEVMVCNGEVCDARYSKMCGGFMEAFESVWNEDPRDYLPAGVDAEAGSDAHSYFPANTEDRAAALIKAKPTCWCNTTTGDVPPYLTYTAPYFRWQVRYEREEAEKLLSRHIGQEIGELKELQPLKRGASGRIEYLRVAAANGEWTVGKELQIRKALSPTCLYSSAFVVEHERDESGKLVAVVLTGGGWGHGAGMCQVGATMMAYRGRNYRTILDQYYPHTIVEKLGKKPDTVRREQIIAYKEPREGERCFEFYNCYAVAGCPVYLKQIRLEAREKAGSFVFQQPADGPKTDLSAEGIRCEFLVFDKESAKPKS